MCCVRPLAFATNLLHPGCGHLIFRLVNFFLGSILEVGGGRRKGEGGGRMWKRKTEAKRDEGGEREEMQTENENKNEGSSRASKKIKNKMGEGVTGCEPENNIKRRGATVHAEQVDFDDCDSWERSMDDLILKAAIWQDEHRVDWYALLKVEL